MSRLGWRRRAELWRLRLFDDAPQIPLRDDAWPRITVLDLSPTAMLVEVPAALPSRRRHRRYLGADGLWCEAWIEESYPGHNARRACHLVRIASIDAGFFDVFAAIASGAPGEVIVEPE